MGQSELAIGEGGIVDAGLGLLDGKRLFDPQAFFLGVGKGAEGGRVVLGQGEHGGVTFGEFGFHLIEADDVGDFHGPCLGSGEAHAEENKTVPAHDVHGAFFTFCIHVINQPKIGLAETIGFQEVTNGLHNMLVFLPKRLRHLKAGDGGNPLAVDVVQFDGNEGGNGGGKALVRVGHDQNSYPFIFFSKSAMTFMMSAASPSMIASMALAISFSVFSEKALSFFSSYSVLFSKAEKSKQLRMS